MQDNKLTGYPSIDKPWLKYYSEEAINAPLPELTIYQYITKLNQDNLEKTAISYYRTNITYGKLFENVSLVAGALESMGVRQGSIVTVCMINSPEEISLILALNKIGAVANLIYGVSTEKDITKYIQNTKSTIVFTLDIFQNKFENIIEKVNLEKVVVISSGQSMDLNYKKSKEILSSLPTIILPHDSRFISWADFMKTASHSDTLICEPNQAAIITYTGGTTGGSKAVLQSNFGVIANVWQYCQMNIQLKREESWLLVFPLFIGFGIFSLLIPLSLGMTVYVRMPMTDTIADICKEFKPNHIMYSPAFWEILANSGENIDLSFLVEPMTGGDVLTPQMEEKISNYLSSHGCDYSIMNGYGMSELGPGISINCKNAYEQNSCGVPFVKNIVSAFDVDTEEELKFGKTGELCVCAPSMMMGYLNDIEETKNIIRKHSDGKLWIHTGDLGFISENGFIHINGRLKRYILHFANGVAKKIFSLDIEKVLNNHPCIEKCAVVPVSNEYTNQAPVAFVVFSSDNTETEDLIESIKRFAAENLEPEYCPIGYHFIEKLPLTKVGKVNYLELEKEAERLIKL